MMNLKIEKKENGSFALWLDETELKWVKHYEIKSSAIKGKAELSVELLVNFPIVQENV